jgi:prolyl oligopeptidase
MPLRQNPECSVVERIYDVAVVGRYQSLEVRSLVQTGTWVDGHQQRCDAYFSPRRDLEPVRLKVREYLDVESGDQPVKMGRRLFRRHGKRYQAQACIRTIPHTGWGQPWLIRPRTIPLRRGAK